jgi:cytochrome P450
MEHTSQYVAVTALPPGPRIPALLQTFAWGLRPLQFAEWCDQRYGTPFTTRAVGGAALVQFSDPESLQEIFGLPASAFCATDATRDILEPFLGENSLLMLDGDRHHDERRIVVRAFHTEAFAAQQQLIIECTERAMRAWPRERAFKMLPEMQSLTLEVMLRAAFGIDDRAQLEALLVPLREFLVLAGSLVILYPPFRERWWARARWDRFLELRDAIDRALLDLIRERRSATNERHDILSALAFATHEPGQLLDEAAVRDHLLTLLLAGHDTTATALGWAFDLLAHQPAVADRLARELETGDDTYLDAVVKETLRVRPVVAEVARTLTQPTRIGGYLLPAGTVASANIHLAHQRHETYADPHAFRPERFIGTHTEPNVWLPFGGGIRRCIGIAFATLEMRTVLRTVVRELHIRPARSKPEPPKRRAVTLIPRHGAPVVLRERVSTLVASGARRRTGSFASRTSPSTGARRARR